MATARKVWNGNAGLQRLVVPVDSLTPHPRNPRRGDVEAIKASLERFGQQRPILALPDGTVVAGNHTLRAAVDAGWTHIAVVRSDLTDAEVEAYLLADNRTGDLGEYEDELLAQLLKPYYDADALLGTGYGKDDVEELLSSLIHGLGEPPGRLDRLGDGETVTLAYSPDEMADFTNWTRMIAREHDTRDLAQTVLVGMKSAAREL